MYFQKCLLAYTLTLLVMLKISQVARAECNAYTGPAGLYECFLINRYDGYQWGTCLTDAYIRQKSKGEHQCEDSSRTYCYYQCMLEVHSVNSGTVTSDCACDPNHTTPTPVLLATTLSPDCYSPSGTDCSWYRRCLEQKFPCTEGSDDYGVKYAEKFCNAYSDNYNSFSSQGQRWVDATRRCLQVALVPLMRSFNNYSCANVRSFAFGSHTRCYLNPDAGAPSVCDLPFSDYMEVFWTIKAAIVTAFSETLFGIREVAMDCKSRRVHELGAYMQQLRIRLQTSFSRLVDQISPVLPFRRARKAARNLRNEKLAIFEQRQRVKRQTTNDTYWQGESTENLYYHKLAGAAADAMAAQLNWTTKGVLWFAFGQQVDSSNLDVYVLLADRMTYDLGYSSSIPRPNMTQVVTQAAQAFQDGDVRIELEGHVVQLRTLDACSDMDCQQVYLNVSAQLTTTQVTTVPTQYLNVSAPFTTTQVTTVPTQYLKVSAPPNTGQATSHSSPWETLLMVGLSAVLSATVF